MPILFVFSSRSLPLLVRRYEKNELRGAFLVSLVFLSVFLWRNSFPDLSRTARSPVPFKPSLPVFLKHGERPSDFSTGLIPLEMVRYFISGKPLCAAKQQIENCVSSRVAQAVTEDESG